jgi:putative flavoprotein involved in K+ transport
MMSPAKASDQDDLFTTDAAGRPEVASPGLAGAPLDVLVIGGGQAGLAMGYHLAQSGRSFQIVDAGAGIGQTWRSRWDSLRLFTSGRYDNLPGLPFPASPDAYPGRDDVAGYLQAYAAKFALPVRLNTSVTSLTRSGGTYVAKAGDEVLEASQVVVATGPFHVPFKPPIAGTLDPSVYQIHSAGYRRPQSVPPGKVLVVGAANSGCQIAQELSATHAVELSAGQRIPAIPQRPLGRDIWKWATALRLDQVTADSRLGSRLAGRDQVIGPGPRRLARRHGIRLRARAASAAGRTVTFADASAADFDAVVWATGFRTDYTWIEIPGLTDEQGRIVHTRGVTRSPGLYVLGLTWQHTRGSALLGWVGNDAAFLAGQIARQ